MEVACGQAQQQLRRCPTFCIPASALQTNFLLLLFLHRPPEPIVKPQPAAAAAPAPAAAKAAPAAAAPKAKAAPLSADDITNKWVLSVREGRGESADGSGLRVFGFIRCTLNPQP